MILGTDSLRAIADGLDADGEELEAFVVLAGVRNGRGPAVRVLSSWAEHEREAVVTALQQGIRMLRGGDGQ